jgi:Fic family protein
MGEWIRVSLGLTMDRTALCHTIRETLTRLPPPYDSHYGVVPPPLLETAIALEDAAPRYEAANAAIARIDAVAAELADPYLVSRVLARNEAVSSSAIEGTNSTLDELLASEENGDEEARSATNQVRSYAAILDTIIPRIRREGDRGFSFELVRSLHRDVMRYDPDYRGVPGDVRTDVVWIGGQGNIAYSTLNPPPPAQVGECLVQTIDYMRNEGMQSMTQGLIVRMALAHAQFEAVHPFRDGNGRVGRLLLPVMMAAAGHVPLYLSPYIELHKAAYYSALKDAQQRLQWAVMIGFMSDAIVGTADELMATRAALARLRNIWLGRRKYRGNSAALRALDLLPHYPIVTITRLAGLLGVSFLQARKAVDQLSSAGILTERTGYSRNRMYAAREALAIINRPFGEDALLPES